MLGYEFDEPFKPPNMNDISREKMLLERVITNSGLLIAQFQYDEMFEKDMEAFEPFFLRAKMKDQQKKEERERLMRMQGEYGDSAADTTGAPKSLSKSKWGKTPRRMQEKAPVVQWQEHESQEGYKYYYRVDLSESSWEKPKGENVQILIQQYDDVSDSWYWHNTTTGEITSI